MTADDEGDGARRKRGLRRDIRAARAARRAAADEPAWRRTASLLAGAVLADPEVRRSCDDGAAVAAYASFGDEPPTYALLDALEAAGARVLLPVVRPHRQLAWAGYAGPDSLAPDAYGIPTPTGEPVGTGATTLVEAGVRVMLVPATAVTPDGLRLGQGGGFYDVLLRDLPPASRGGPVRLAIVFEGEVLDELPAEPHDARIDRAIAIAIADTDAG